ncbi:MAG: hypothetical protein WDN10_02670 [bacterium]
MRIQTWPRRAAVLGLKTLQRLLAEVEAAIPRSSIIFTLGMMFIMALDWSVDLYDRPSAVGGRLTVAEIRAASVKAAECLKWPEPVVQAVARHDMTQRLEHAVSLRVARARFVAISGAGACRVIAVARVFTVFGIRSQWFGREGEYGVPQGKSYFLLPYALTPDGLTFVASDSSVTVRTGRRSR